MPFQCFRIDHEVDPFGLGVRHTLEFRNADGSVIHQYTKEGRFVIKDGKTTAIATSQKDVRFLVGNDTELLRQIDHHLQQFDLVEASAGSSLPVGLVDVSSVRPAPPAPSDGEVAARAYAEAKQKVAILAELVPVDDPSLVKATQALDAAKDTYAGHVKAAVEASREAVVRP